MAASCSSLSEVQFKCCICLDVFIEPVSIPCGHNFCKACLTKHWEGKEQCQCPLCNQKFNKGLKLRVNTELRDILEKCKEQNAKKDSYCPVKPGQVPCDCFFGNICKASKTCLVCLTSYCETHLEPHLRVVALKRHKLTDPVHNLESQICKKHNRMLELSNRNDQTPVCVLCTEISAPNTVPMKEAYVDKKAPMGKKKVEVQEIKHRRVKNAQNKNQSVRRKQKGRGEVMANCGMLSQMQGPGTWWIPNILNSNDDIRNKYFSQGIYYTEVQAEGRTSRDSRDVRESMHGSETFILDLKNGNWVVRLGIVPNPFPTRNTQRKFPCECFHVNNLKRVKLIVDYDNGVVIGVDADTGNWVFTTNGCKFNKKTYLYYCPSTSLSQILINKVQEVKAWLNSSQITVCLCLIALFLLLDFIMCLLTNITW